jgi:hypothetical protein
MTADFLTLPYRRRRNRAFFWGAADEVCLAARRGREICRMVLEALLRCLKYAGALCSIFSADIPELDDVLLLSEGADAEGAWVRLRRGHRTMRL